MGKNPVKLLLNILLLANAAVPRGGTIKVSVIEPVDSPTFRFECSGPSARVPAVFEHIVPGDIAGESIDAHAIQPYYTGLLARLCRMRITGVIEDENVVIIARPVA